MPRYGRSAQPAWRAPAAPTTCRRSSDRSTRRCQATIVPYGQTPPDTLSSTGKVQFAIGDTESDVPSDFASGLKITSVMAVLQTNPTFFGVLSSNTAIKSPKDFCNQTYGGFGYPGDPAIIAAVIQGAGGPAQCHVSVVTLGSSAYQAVESRQVGFSAFFFSDDHPGRGATARQPTAV